MKKLVVMLFSILIVAFSGFCVCAAETPQPTAADTTVSTQAIEPRADIIVTKYRMNNGVLQYRRWNSTQEYWVDPYWINA